MAELGADIEQRISALAADRESGASDLLEKVVRLLQDTLDAGHRVLPVARALCQAQPSMAPVWNAALEAMVAEGTPGRFHRFVQRMPRASEALQRFALAHFALDAPRPLTVLTLSFSRTVMNIILGLSRSRSIQVACSESRPALEGRRLASRLAAAGIPVSCFSDAALAHALPRADFVLLGADAVSREWFLNKVGTRMLAAAASHQGVPVYVTATRDKFVSDALALRLVVREGAAAEVWDAPPAGVEVRNPYFETTPLDLVGSVITDVGVLDAAMVRDVCGAAADPLVIEALKQLG